jgi:hypothetical protein
MSPMIRASGDNECIVEVLIPRFVSLLRPHPKYRLPADRAQAFSTILARLALFGADRPRRAG